MSALFNGFLLSSILPFGLCVAKADLFFRKAFAGYLKSWVFTPDDRGGNWLKFKWKKKRAGYGVVKSHARLLGCEKNCFDQPGHQLIGFYPD